MGVIDLNISKKIFNEAYYPFLTDYTKRYEIYYGGAGSGKSVFICQKLLVKACTSQRKVLIIRKFGTTLKDSVFQLFTDMLKKWQLYNFCKVNLSTYTITLPNDSVILFKGLDDSEKIKSITDITDIWVEECTELSEDEYTQLDLRLRANSGNLQLICSFNPVSKANWVYKKWFARDYNIENTMILKTTYKDNKFLPLPYIEALEEKQKTNYNYYKIYALGEFCSLDKLIFTNWKTGTVDNKSNLQLLCGLDFGYVNDATAFIASYLDETNKVIYIDDEMYAKGLLNDEIAATIKHYGYGKEVIIADSAEQKSIEEIKRAGVTRIKAASKGKGSILQGIQKLQQYQLIVNPECVNMITELQNYCWRKDKQTNEYINEPIDNFNHCIDALRYSLQCVKQKVALYDKNIFGF